MITSGEITGHFVSVSGTLLRKVESISLRHLHPNNFDGFRDWVDALGPAFDRPTSYTQSIACIKGRIIVLGEDQRLTTGCLYAWSGRIDLIKRHQSIVDAIAVALTLYREEPSVAVIGLPIDHNHRLDEVQKYVLVLLLELVDIELSTTTDDTAGSQFTAAEDVIRDLVPFAVDTCLAVDGQDFLFGTIFPKLRDDESRHAMFFDAISTCIVEGRITRLDPASMQAFVEYHRKAFLHDRLEECIVHLDPASFDIHQLVTTCRQLRLFNALIYVYNAAMMDYVGPVAEVLKEIEKDIGMSDNEDDAEASARVQTDYKLFAYLAYVLTGKAFPSAAPLAPAIALKARRDIYGFLFASQHVDGMEIGSASQYPYLKLLLRFDAAEFFRVLALALDDPFLDGHERLVDVAGKGSPKQSSHDGITTRTAATILDRQFIVTKLWELMTKSQPPFAERQILALYGFVARSLAKFGHSSLTLPDGASDMMLQELSAPRLACKYPQECEAALVSLIAYQQPTLTEEDRLLGRFEEVGFHRICEEIYHRRRDYGRMVESIVRSEQGDGETVYMKLHKSLGSAIVGDDGDDAHSLSLTERQALRDALHNAAGKLASQCPYFFARLLLEYFPDDVVAVIRLIEGPRAAQVRYGLLQQIFALASEDDSPHFTAVPVELHETYLEHMCMFDAAKVHHYLQTTPLPFRMEFALALGEKFRLLNLAVWALEAMDRTPQALDMVLASCQRKVDKFLKRMEMVRARSANDGGDNHLTLDVDDRKALRSFAIKLGGYLKTGTQICQRSFNTHGKNQSELLWFRLLDFGISLQYKRSAFAPWVTSTSAPSSPVYASSTAWSMSALRDSHQYLDAAFPPELLLQHLVDTLRTHLHLILDSMMGHVNDLPSILRKLMSASQTGSKPFADFRDIFSSVLRMHDEEMKLLTTARRIARGDGRVCRADFKRKEKRAFDLDEMVTCTACEGPLIGALQGGVSGRFFFEGNDQHQEEDADVVVFGCGHLFHGNCYRWSTDDADDRCTLCLAEAMDPEAVSSNALWSTPPVLSSVFRSKLYKGKKKVAVLRIL